MIPKLSEKTYLNTNIDKVNKLYKIKANTIDYKNTYNNMSISLKYNGKSMKLVYDSNILNKDNNIKYERLKSKVKRVLIKKVKELI